MSTKTTIDPAQSPKVERGVRKFLDALNSNARVCLPAADLDPVSCVHDVNEELLLPQIGDE